MQAGTRAAGDGNLPTYRRSVVPAKAGAEALPLVAIVGRPNVGKSTLFNRLTHSRRSIVGDEPGITRDRIYGEYEWAGRQFRLVDTGGIVPDDPELIPTEIYNQAKVALERSGSAGAGGGRAHGAGAAPTTTWCGCCGTAASRCFWR